MHRPLVPLQQRTGMLGTLSPGVHALALAVLEEGIRDYVYAVGSVRIEVEAWVDSHGGQSPFAFDAVCETLGLAPDAVRASVRKLRTQRSDTDRRRRLRPSGNGRSRRVTETHTAYRSSGLDRGR